MHGYKADNADTELIGTNSFNPTSLKAGGHAQPLPGLPPPIVLVLVGQE